MTVADIVKQYRVDKGPGTRMLSYREMAKEISKFVAGGVSRGAIYLWMRGTQPRKVLVQAMIDHGEGWVKDLGCDLMTALDSQENSDAEVQTDSHKAA